MNKVKQIIHAINPTCVIFGGDLNTDTSRTSPHTRGLLQCVVDFCLTICIDLNESKVPYTYIGPNSNMSQIDHFLISDIMSESVIDSYVIDDHLHSNHLPVILSLDFNISHSSVSKRPHMFGIKPMITTLICISLSLMNNCLILLFLMNLCCVIM